MADTLTLDDLTAWFTRFADEITVQADWLTELDSAIGDADHGTNMVRGSAAAARKLEEARPEDTALLLKTVGLTIVSTVGGASGSLYGTLFLEMGRHSPTGSELTPAQVESAFQAGVAGVIARGKAELGDKTMIDALEPAVTAMTLSINRGSPLPEALARAADAADTGRESTRPLVARKGRASYLGDRSCGHLDPGSASAAILIRSLASITGEKNT